MSSMLVARTTSSGSPCMACDTHTHATLLLKAGVPVKVVSERLGHADPGFALRLYAHVLPSMQADAARRITAPVDR